MRIDGGTKAGTGQQAQTRFEQVMSRELSRSSSAKTPTETNIRTTLTPGSRKSAPGSERVGTSFKAAQAGKILKGLQDSARQIMSKAMTLVTQGSKTASAKLGQAAEAAMTKAQTIKDGPAGKALSKAGATLGDAGSALSKRMGGQKGDAASTSKGAGAGAGEGSTRSAQTPGAQTSGAQAGGAKTAGTLAPGAQTAGGQTAGTLAPGAQSAGAQTAGTLAPGAQTAGGRTAGTLAPGTQSAGAQTPGASTQGTQTAGPPGSGALTQGTQSAGAQTGTPTQTMAPGAGGERAAFAPAAPATADATAIATPGVNTEAAGAQEGRAALALQDASSIQEGFLLLNPGLQSVSRRAKSNGSALRMVYQLGLNAFGAEFVSITTDDKGYITGPDMDIALTEGALDTNDNWVALSGEGMLRGRKVTLEPDADGCVFVTDGEEGVPKSVTAWLGKSDAIHAEVVAVRHLR